MPFNLIYNRLKILLDPRYFASKSTIEAQVGLTTMLQDYLEKTEPTLCSVAFYYPKNIEEKLNLRRVFNVFDRDIIFTKEHKNPINFFEEKIDNEILSLAIENQTPFILSPIAVTPEQKDSLLRKYNISILNISELQDKIKSFLQGFYNYYKFDLLQGVDDPGIAHAMSDPIHRKLSFIENDVKNSKLEESIKERIRSLVHNRYIDILITIEKINFYKIQQQISDMERGILENKNPQFHGPVRYYLNYYLLLLWGFLDHLCWTINDLFSFGYNPDDWKDFRRVGFRNTKDKEDFLDKIKKLDLELSEFILSNDFQEWINVLGQLRHKNAHKEMVSPSPLLQPTKESQNSNEEIDKILYKDNPPLDARVAAIAPQLIEEQKRLDRYHYKLSKMKKVLDHIAIVKEGYFDPVARINIDMRNINKLTNFFINIYNKRQAK